MDDKTDRPADSTQQHQQATGTEHPPETAENFEHTIKRLISARNARREDSSAPYR